MGCRHAVPLCFVEEPESVESLLEKPAALALQHDGYHREDLMVALARMMQRHGKLVLLQRDLY